MTVRQVFYQATVAGIVEKTEAGYAKVQTDLVVMRRAGELPYGWLADNTRWQRKPRTFDSVEDALEETARFYRKALWTDADAYVEIWLEKDALSGVIYPVTAIYDVPLMVARGYASLSFLHSAAEYIKDARRADLHLPPRRLRSVGRECRREDRADAEGDGAGRRNPLPAHRRHPRADRATGICRPGRPRPPTAARRTSATSRSSLTRSSPTGCAHLVQEAIERHLPADQFAVLKAAEESRAGDHPTTL